MGAIANHARRYYENNFSFIPVEGKAPKLHGWNELCHRTPTEIEVQKWEEHSGDHNIGLPAGPANGVVWLDCDSYTPKYCDELLRRLPGVELKRIGSKGFGTPILFMGQRSRKFYYRGLKMGEILGVGTQLVVEGIHPDTGQPYRWEGAQDFGDLSRNELVELAITVTEEQLDAIFAELEKIDFELDPRDQKKIGQQAGVGGRNDALKKIAGGMFEKAKSVDEVAAELLSVDKRQHKPPLFSDPSEYHGMEPLAAARRFAGSIYATFVRNKTARGELLPMRTVAPTRATVFVTQPIDALIEADLTDILPHWYWSKPKKDEPSEPTRPKATFENLRALLNHLGVTMRYNMVSKVDEVMVPGLKATQGNHANVVMAHLTSWSERIGMAVKHVYPYAQAISDENAYSPIADWINSAPWDGEDRLQLFFDTVVGVDEAETKDGAFARAFKERLMRVWLIQAVAAVYNSKGISAGGMLVFQGDQYLGKTKWFKSLLPDELAACRADGVTLHTQEKDSVLGVIAHWLVELGELDATFKRSDIAQLKAFVGKDTDKVRRPFARGWSDYPRRTVFFASVNDAKFLNDPTGSRRFYVVECKSIDHSHQINMQQLWAQIKTFFDAGESYYLTPDEVKILSERNQKFEQLNPLYELVATKFNWEADKALWTHQMSATDVVLAVGIRITSAQRESTQMAGVLKKFGLYPHRRRTGGNYYIMPPLIRYGSQP